MTIQYRLDFFLEYGQLLVNHLLCQGGLSFDAHLLVHLFTCTCICMYMYVYVYCFSITSFCRVFIGMDDLCLVSRYCNIQIRIYMYICVHTHVQAFCRNVVKVWHKFIVKDLGVGGCVHPPKLSPDVHIQYAAKKFPTMPP